MRRVWHVASSSAEYVESVELVPSVGVAEGMRVADDEVDVAEASRLLDGAVGGLGVDRDPVRYGSNGRVLCGSR